MPTTNTYPYTNAKFLSISAGQTGTIPQGFFMASVNPGSGATYTITNGLSEVSNSISAVFSFPYGLAPAGYEAHVITASGGTVTVVYFTGN